MSASMDIYSVLTPALYLSKLVGLAPFSLEGEPGSRCYVPQRENIAYCVVLALLLIASDVYSFIGSQDGNVNVSSAVTLIQLQAELGLALLVILMNLYQAKKSIKFYKDVDDLDKTLKACNIDISFSFTQRFSLTQTAVGCVGFVGAIPLAYYVTLSYPDFNFLQWFVYWVTYLIPKLINFCFASNFVDGVMLLKHRFSLINAQLEEIGASDKDLMSFPLRNGLIHVKPMRKMSLMSRFDRIQNMHYALCDLVKDINGIYAVQILLYIALIFTSVTIGLNTCFMAVTAKQPGKDIEANIPFSVLCMYALFFAAIQITVIALGCAYTSAEANKTATLVHKLLIDYTDEAVKSELELFSLQLLHRKVQLTACGFFPIDATLLYSIVGGVTTYLVILIQFQLAPAPTSADPAGSNNSLANATTTTPFNLTNPSLNLTIPSLNVTIPSLNVTTNLTTPAFNVTAL